MIGQKGLPAKQGGVEHHVEQLGARLVERGHEVVVFTRPNYSDPAVTEYRGMRLKSVPTLGTKHLDAIVHSFLSTLATWAGGYDIVHYHAIGPTLVSPLARLRGRKVTATIHGQDWRRAKWGRFASLVLRLGEWVTLRAPHVTISVSRSLADYYRAQGHSRVHYIPNGVFIDESDDLGYLRELGLDDGRYALFVGRLVPEKGIHYLLDAWARPNPGLPLVIVGDTSHTDEYVASLQAAEADVRFTGCVYGVRLATLFRHAGLFILPSDLEGLPIVLLEAMAYGVPVLASDIAPNVEAAGNHASYFRAGDTESLRSRLTELLPRLAMLKADAAAHRAAAIVVYDWDRVVDETEQLYESVLRA